MTLIQLFSFNTPRASLRWPVLIALILFTLAVLWIVWAITESQWIQWAVIVLALFAWNSLVVRAGDQDTGNANTREGFVVTGVALFLAAVALLGLAAITVSVFQNSALFPGRQAIQFMVISVPLMVWVNLHLRHR